ncbi:hypothetical protein Hypma_002388 [Hypsizygus marmoreus]|uniref:Uncharacterized protein n=1 Tax=Hypsizygus marmoreus TaxID=39966 RepID=A0A369J5T4_HYPMA|nr:hypothetical protein Hypma_002388 [Hypsizygus marmoreus]
MPAVDGVRWVTVKWTCMISVNKWFSVASPQDHIKRSSPLPLSWHSKAVGWGTISPRDIKERRHRNHFANWKIQRQKQRGLPQKIFERTGVNTGPKI